MGWWALKSSVTIALFRYRVCVMQYVMSLFDCVWSWLVESLVGMHNL